jgi:hypothetical protein
MNCGYRQCDEELVLTQELPVRSCFVYSIRQRCPNWRLWKPWHTNESHGISQIAMYVFEVRKRLQKS